MFSVFIVNYSMPKTHIFLLEKHEGGCEFLPVRGNIHLFDFPHFYVVDKNGTRGATALEHKKE